MPERINGSVSKTEYLGIVGSNPTFSKIIIYTDGSCYKNPGPGGLGLYILHKDKKLYLSIGNYNYTTNNIMEIIAFIKALEYLKYNTGTIYSDSLYVVNGYNIWLNNWSKNWVKPKLNNELWKKIYELKCVSNVKVYWIKAHNNIEPNEIADQLAKNAIKICHN